jgi:hypothetical protein
MDMTLTMTDPEAHRAQLRERVNLAMQGYAAKGHTFSMKNVTKEIDTFGTEMLEHVVRILEGDEYYDGIELINDICIVRSHDRMLTTIKLHQQLNNMNHYPNPHVGFRQCRFHLDALLSYGTDVAIPRYPIGGEAVHPKHLALLVVTDVVHVLCSTNLSFNLDDQPYDYMSKDAYRLTDDELVDHLLSNPELGEQTARLVFNLKTLRFDVLRPFVDLMNERPEDEDHIIDLLEKGYTRDVEIRELLAGRTIPALAEGVL